MRLLSLRVRNFRCFQEEVEVAFDEFTSLIGKNDAGKSSIMDALDIFLNDGTPDGDDASKGGDPEDLVICCEFDELPTSLVLDSSATTSLTDEYLLNSRGHLEIEKRYSGHLVNPKLVSVSARAVHPTADGVSDLLQLKNKALKARAKSLGVDLSEVDQKENPALRRAIRSFVEDLEPEESVVPLHEENGKDIWGALSTKVPAFQLFQSDRASTDQDPEAQDPLKMAIKEAIKDKETELASVMSYVEERVREIANATLDKLNEMDPGLAQELSPTFAKPSWDRLFKASIVGDQGIPINKRGSGVRRLILLNFFRAKAELQARTLKRSKVVYGIEEPETSQHPRNQRLLLRALQELSTESQVIITSHTPMLVRGAPDSGLRYVEVRPDESRNVRHGSEETNELVAKSLGVLPDNSVRLFIGVEGPNDISFLAEMAKNLREEDEAIPDLEQLELDGEVVFFPLGGSTLARWVTRLEPLRRPEFHLFDRDTEPPDPPRYQESLDEINARDRCEALCTGKREMENYLHGAAIRAAYAANGLDIELPDVFGAFDDVPVTVARVVYENANGAGAWEELEEERQSKKESKIKRFLNSQAVAAMTPAQVEQVDPDGDIRSWFDRMSQLMETEQA